MVIPSVHQTRVSTLSGWARALSSRLWVPVALRLLAFASRVFLFPLGSWAALTVGLLGDRPLPDPIGVSTFRTLEMRLGRMDPLPRSRGVLDTGFWVAVSVAGELSVPPALWLNKTVSATTFGLYA